MASSPPWTSAVELRQRRLARLGWSHVFGRLRGGCRRPFGGRRWQSTGSAGWPCARAVRTRSGSAPPAIEGTCTAARAARRSPAATASAAHGAVTDAVPRAGSTIAIGKENVAGAVASRRAWGITLPRTPRPRSRCSPRPRRRFPMYRSRPPQPRACAAPSAGVPCSGSLCGSRGCPGCSSPDARPLPEARP
jgi:hypothetical protein